MSLPFDNLTAGVLLEDVDQDAAGGNRFAVVGGQRGGGGRIHARPHRLGAGDRVGAVAGSLSSRPSRWAIRPPATR